jgi:hypothetical protein
MFDNLDITNSKKFRKSILNELVAFLKSLREANENITSSLLWGDIQELKGQLFSNDISINQLILIVKNKVLKKSDDLDKKLATAFTDFVNIGNNPKYEIILGKSVSEIGTSSSLFQPKKETESQSGLSLANRLLGQLDNIDKKGIEKIEVVSFLMTVSAPRHYNGHLIDMDKNIISNINRHGLNDIHDIRGRLAEIENRTDQLLVSEIDKLIEKSISEAKPRQQIILKSGGHYTCVDIDIKNSVFLIVDAAQDFRRIRLYAMAKHSKYITQVIDVTSPGFEFDGKKINGGELQKSEHGCWIFSLFHSFALAQMNGIHAELISKAKVDPKSSILNLDWIDLPPAIVSLAQSITFLNYYKHARPEYTKEIDSLTNNNTKAFGYNKAVTNFRMTVEKTCSTMPDSEIQNIIGLKSSSYKSIYLNK